MLRSLLLAAVALVAPVRARSTGPSHLRPHVATLASLDEAPVCAKCVRVGIAKPNCCSTGGTWEGMCDQGGLHTWSEGFHVCNTPEAEKRAIEHEAEAKAKAKAAEEEAQEAAASAEKKAIEDNANAEKAAQEEAEATAVAAEKAAMEDKAKAQKDAQAAAASAAAYAEQQTLEDRAKVEANSTEKGASDDHATEAADAAERAFEVKVKEAEAAAAAAKTEEFEDKAMTDKEVSAAAAEKEAFEDIVNAEKDAAAKASEHQPQVTKAATEEAEAKPAPKQSSEPKQAGGHVDNDMIVVSRSKSGPEKQQQQELETREQEQKEAEEVEQFVKKYVHGVKPKPASSPELKQRLHAKFLDAKFKGPQRLDAACGPGGRAVTENECLAAVQEAAAAQTGVEVTGFKAVFAGADETVPSGCSYSLHSKRAVFNRSPDGSTEDNNWYWRVCVSTKADESSLSKTTRYSDDISDDPQDTAAPDCYCFDVCDGGRRHLNAEGNIFIGRTRGVSIHDPKSPWAAYFNAVYSRRSPMPHELHRLSFFYTNSPGWRAKHRFVANPFHDCYDREQPRCGDCSAWERELPTSGITTEPMGMFFWPQYKREAADLHGVQVYSRDSADHGRALGEDGSWIEIMRSDVRPYFAEGERPPDCPDWQAGEPYRSQACWSRLYQVQGGRFAPGCWARPAAGTGVWINVGNTSQRANFNGLNPVDAVLNASSDGLDTVQFQFGDAVAEIDESRNLQPPLLLMTGSGCIDRRDPLKACLPVEMKSGWYDEPCPCDDSTAPHVVSRDFLEAVRQQGDQQPADEGVQPGEPYPLSGPLNCGAVSPPEPPLGKWKARPGAKAISPMSRSEGWCAP